MSPTKSFRQTLARFMAVRRDTPHEDRVPLFVEAGEVVADSAR
jgi:hypothetical protein